MKKLALVFGGLFGLFVVAALVVPLVLNVDKYRPQIAQKAGEYLNGKLELGKLELSLWGRVKINIDGLKLSDSKNRSVVEVKDASFDLPFLSLLSGRPEVRLHLVSPLVSLVKDRNGKLNALTLVKETPRTGAPAPTGQKATATNAPAGKTEVPGIVMSSRITVLLDHAKVGYKDLVTGDSYDVSDLNFRLEDVSPSSDMPFELTANLDLLVQKHIKVAGPLVLEGNVKATSSGGAFEKAEVKTALKLDGLEINDPGLFEKKQGVPLGAELTASLGTDTFAAPRIEFHLAQVNVKGEASGKTANGVTTIDFKAHSNKVDLAKLSELSPLVTRYGINGLVEVEVNASGPTHKLGYGAKLKFNKITLENEALKQPLEVNGSVAVVTNQVRSMTVKVTAPKGFDVTVDGSLQNFLAPKFKFKLASSEMDLDGLLKASEKAAQARKQHADAQLSGKPAEGEKNPGHPQPVVDYNAMLAPLHKNPIAAAAAGTFDFDLKHIKSTGVSIDGLKGQLALNNLLLALKDFSMKIFDGSIKGTMSFNARSAKPEVATKISVAGLQTQKMVESSMPIARNTIKGAISASLNIGGSGLNQSDIIAGWKGNGSLDIKDAVLSTLDIGGQVKKFAIDKAPPFLKGKINIPDKVLDKRGRYQTVSAKFALTDGVMHLNDFTGKAYPKEGFDLKGKGIVKLANYGLDMTLDIIDTYNVAHADEHVKDSRYGHFTLSPKVGCTLFNPCFDYAATLGKLAESALKTEGKKRLEDLAKKHLGGNPAVGKAVGSLLNKLGGGGGDSGGNNQQNSQKPAAAIGNALKGLFGH